MSSLGQSILMALTVTVNKYASSNVQAVVHRRETKLTNISSRRTQAEEGRRSIILASVISASTQVSDSKTELLKKYLKKSEENKAKNDKERMDSYYKRNYKDYFEFEGGAFKAKNEQELSESEKGILGWLKKTTKLSCLFLIIFLVFMPSSAVALNSDGRVIALLIYSV